MYFPAVSLTRYVYFVTKCRLRLALALAVKGKSSIWDWKFNNIKLNKLKKLKSLGNETLAQLLHTFVSKARRENEYLGRKCNNFKIYTQKKLKWLGKTKHPVTSTLCSKCKEGKFMIWDGKFNNFKHNKQKFKEVR